MRYSLIGYCRSFPVRLKSYWILWMFRRALKLLLDTVGVECVFKDFLDIIECMDKQERL